jgi:glycylpeptide N-tetradecanoyltransferase
LKFVYVEPVLTIFRALKAPGWKNFWHVGVRATTNKRLVACIFGVPIDLRIRGKTFRCAEVNYLCVHKKLRSKRLAPVLIREITRRFNLEGIFQAIYTAGIVLPSPISTCRYFHRTLDFDKLYDVGFSRLPQGVTPARQRVRFRLPNVTSLEGFREMEPKDIVPVGELLAKYLERFDMAQVFSVDEIDHWLLHREGAKSEAERVVWAYVIEKNGKITDFVSYYRLESTIIKQQAHNHKVIKAAYLYYYATDVAFENDQAKLKTRLNELMKDALILAKKV